MTKVAIVDDHSVVRYGLKYMLKLGRDIKLAGEGSTADDAVRLAGEEKPDVILLDVRMPGRDGISALEEILKESPGQKVIMLTTSDAEEDVFRSLRLGAKGYVLKDADPETLIEAIRTVAAGGTVFSDEIMRTYETRAASKGLSAREKDVIAAVSKGFTNQEIADLLGVSFSTVKIHLKHAFEKLEVSDRAEAIAAAIRRGIIDG